MFNGSKSWDYIAIVLFIAAAPFIFGGSYFMNTVNIIGIYAIAVLGLHLILGLTGLISLGHAAFFGLGAYISAYISIHSEIPGLISSMISCLAVAVIAYLVSLPLLRLSGYFLALGTLGLGVIVHSLINGSGKITGGPNGMASIPGYQIFSYSFSSLESYFYLIWITLLVVFMISKNIWNSRTGRALVAIHSDEQAASFFGVNVFSCKLKIFVLGSTLAALAGSYYAHYMLFISPEIVSLHQSINLIVMGFLGGLGVPMGAILGAGAFQIIPEISEHFNELEPLIKGIILLLIVLYFPGGIYGGFRALYRRLASLAKIRGDSRGSITEKGEKGIGSA
jgi:branched-chain amino acid transport system permease protein